MVRFQHNAPEEQELQAKDMLEEMEMFRLKMLIPVVAEEDQQLLVHLHPDEMLVLEDQD
jgi:hypothetical protein